jgi:hypothetical protein
MARPIRLVDPWLMTPEPEDLIEGFGGGDYVGADQHPGPLVDLGNGATGDVRQVATEQANACGTGDVSLLAALQRAVDAARAERRTA